MRHCCLLASLLLSGCMVHGQGAPAVPFVTQSEENSSQHLRHKVAPVYPLTAHCVQGKVVVRVLINEAGTVSRATVVSGPEALRKAAIQAAKQRVYDPFFLNGVPQPYTTTATFEFKPPPPGACERST